MNSPPTPAPDPSIPDAAVEAAVRAALARVCLGPDGPDVLSAGHVYEVVSTGGAVRVLLDPERCPNEAQEALAETLGPLVEALPGVARVVFKHRPRAIALREALPGIARVVGVHSGKGGVGKSTLAANLAVTLAAAGLRVGLLDADVYGPSCPALLGVSGRAREHGDGARIAPFEAHGVKLMSLGFLMPAEQALLWRGSLVDEGLPALLDDVAWGELDLLLVDLPPGTSDVHLALARQVRLAGIVAVSAPGETAVDDVRRGIEMFADLAVPCLGLVENLAGVRCRGCGESRPVFGAGGVARLCAQTDLPLLASIPFEPAVAARSDAGVPAVLAEPDSALARAVAAVAEVLQTLLDQEFRRRVAP